MPLGHGGMEV